MHTESHNPARLAVTFDDDRAVAGAGLALAAVLSERLDLVAWADELVDLGDRPGHARPGRKVATLVHAMVAGAECIDDCDVLRSGSTSSVLGHHVMAPSTLSSSGPSPSVMFASSTPSLSRCWPMHGAWVPARAKPR